MPAMTKRQTDFWYLCNENMDEIQQDAWWKLVEGLPNDFLQLSLATLKAVDEHIVPVYLMYAKAAGKGPSVYADPLAFKFMLMFESHLELLKKERPPKVRCIGVCCAPGIHCVFYIGSCTKAVKRCAH